MGINLESKFNKDGGVKPESLAASQRLAEQLDKEVEFGCISSRMCI